MSKKILTATFLFSLTVLWLVSIVNWCWCLTYSSSFSLQWGACCVFFGLLHYLVFGKVYFVLLIQLTGTLLELPLFGFRVLYQIATGKDVSVDLTEEQKVQYGEMMVANRLQKSTKNLNRLEKSSGSAEIAKALVERAAILSEMKKNEEAINDYKKAIKLDAQSIKALEGLGRLYLALQKFPEAKSCFDKAIDIDPRAVSFYQLRAAASFHAEQFNLAIQDCNSVLALNSRYYQAFFLLAEIYVKLDRCAEALSAVNQCLEIRPQNRAALLIKGKILKNLGQDSLALDCFDKVISSGEFLLSAYLTRADIDLRLKNFDVLYHDATASGDTVQAVNNVSLQIETGEFHTRWHQLSLVDNRFVTPVTHACPFVNTMSS